MPAPPNHGTAIERLIAIMARLRAPDGGCPWDLEQSFETIAPYTIEEAYEVLDAIERGDMPALRDELGDLLFQVVYHARLAEEQGYFGFDDVAAGSVAKMIRRHPHVFDAPSTSMTSAEQVAAWEATKAAERRSGQSDPSALAGVARALPALTRAAKIQKRAARVGFDWTAPGDVLDKIAEEIGELGREMEAGSSKDRLEDELGDVLFTVVNLARRLDLDPEFALRRATDKFSRRFRGVEALSRSVGVALEDQPIEALEAFWRIVKHQETADRAED